MYNAKKLMGLALLLNVFGFTSVFAIFDGIEVINTFNNPHPVPEGQGRTEYDEYQSAARKTICFNFVKELGNCTVLSPINSKKKNSVKTYPGTPSKFFVSVIPSSQKNHDHDNAVVFDLDAARKQYGISIKSIHVVTSPEGIDYIILNNNTDFKVNGTLAMAPVRSKAIVR